MTSDYAMGLIAFEIITSLNNSSQGGYGTTCILKSVGGMIINRERYKGIRQEIAHPSSCQFLSACVLYTLRWWWYYLSETPLLSDLTLNVQGPNYSTYMSVTSPGHQNPCHWLLRTGQFVSHRRKYIHYLCHVNVEEWYILHMHFLYFL